MKRSTLHLYCLVTKYILVILAPAPPPRKKKPNTLSNIDGGSKGFDMEVDPLPLNYANDEIILSISS